MVNYLKYLGRVISATDDDWPEVFINMAKAQAVWRRLTRILSREGAAPRVSEFFFKSVVHMVLIFGTETWVVTPLYGPGTGGFPVPGDATVDREAPMEID